MTDELLPWVIFNVFVLAFLALDLGVLHRKDRAVGVREALLWSAFWIILALLFNLGIYFWHGSEAALAFLTGYVIERSLSIDNLFVFLMIFSYFGVPARYQHKILFWGIFGALVMRAVFILAGVALIQKFYWLSYVFGAFLIVAGIRMALRRAEEIHPERNPVLTIFRKLMSVAEGYEEGSFFVKRAGRYFATSLFLVLVLVETTDVIFALDSIPAILAITQDPFIVYTSNVFAILGLRALYFALAGIMNLFHYLRQGLSAVLIFVGIKMLIAHAYKIPVTWALAVVSGILIVSIALSVIKPRSGKQK